MESKNLHELAEYLGLANEIHQTIYEHELYLEKGDEFTALSILDEIDRRKMSYGQAIEACFICKPFLSLNKQTPRHFSGHKKAFGIVLYDAVLALQTQINPPLKPRIKNKASLDTYLPAIKSLAEYAGNGNIIENDFCALIRLALILEYDCQNLIVLFKNRFPDQPIFKTTFG